jgi:hypothetical protein
MDTYTKSDKVADELIKRFTYHAPKGTQNARYGEIRDEAHKLADILVANCPESRELSLALTNLEQMVFWANAAIARNE